MKKISSTYLVAQHLIKRRKSYIHDLKRTCKCNNPMQRVLQLRRAFGWEIETVLHGYDGKVAIYFYVVKKRGGMPCKYV